MDTQQLNSFVDYTAHTLPPAQLWIGNHDELVDNVQRYAQKLLCKNNGCQTCVTCMQIRDKQHHALMWLHPDKTYTIEQLDDLFTTITFRLQDNELFFFIIQKADFLTTACANKLLKSIEEPPAGYHFILLAERAEQIVPTIMSRCTLYVFSHTKQQITEHPLFASFTRHKTTTVDFSKIVDSCGITERDTIELLDAIMNYWLAEYKNNKNAPENKNCPAEAIISLLKNAYAQLPMPGSALIFWRNLYLLVTPLLQR
jgi:DNA polymerase-3 subunit delta'